MELDKKNDELIRKLDNISKQIEQGLEDNHIPTGIKMKPSLYYKVLSNTNEIIMDRHNFIVSIFGLPITIADKIKNDYEFIYGE